MKIFILLIIFIILMIVSYMTIKKNSPSKEFSYEKKYKENSIKLSKNGINDSRYIYGFEHVKGNEIKLLKEYNISQDLIDLYSDLKLNDIDIAELGVGFDNDKEIKKVYYLEEGEKNGYGVKSDGTNIIYSEYIHKNELRDDLKKLMFTDYETNMVFNILFLKPKVKYYLKTDFLNKTDLKNSSNEISNSVHIAYYDRIQEIEQSKEIIKYLCNYFNLITPDDNWFKENKGSLIDYIAFTKIKNNDIEITIYYTKQD